MRKSLSLNCVIFSAILTATEPADLFRTHCAPCHGPNGDGGRGANLAVRHWR